MKYFFYLKHYLAFMLPTWARNIFSTISSDEPGVQLKLHWYILSYVLVLGFIGLLYPTGIAIGRKMKKQNTPVIYSIISGLSTVFLVDVTYNHRILSFVLIVFMGIALPFLPINPRAHDDKSPSI